MTAHLESFVEREILAALGQRRDLKIWKSKVYMSRDPNGQIVGGLSLPEGHSDLAGVLRGGRALYIEVKGPTGVQRPEQVVFQRVVESMGALYILARSVKEVLAALPPVG